MSLTVTVNGERREVPEGATIARLVEQVGGERRRGRGVAVAVGGEVVPRGRWDETTLADGASIEIVVAVQGG